MLRLPFLTALILVLFSHSSLALRCGSSIVDTGDTRERVERICGQPNATSSRYVRRSIDQIADRELRARLKRSSGNRQIKIEVRIDEWTYLLGPRRFDKVVVFENGRVIDVKDAD